MLSEYILSMKGEINAVRDGPKKRLNSPKPSIALLAVDAVEWTSCTPAPTCWPTLDRWQRRLKQGKIFGTRHAAEGHIGGNMRRRPAGSSE